MGGLSLCLLFLFKTAVAGELQLRPCCTGQGHRGPCPEVNTLKGSLPFGQLSRSPQMQVGLPWVGGGGGRLSHSHPSFLHPRPPKPPGQMRADESGGRVGEQTAASRVPARAASWSTSACRLTAPGGAAVRPTWCPAWPSLTTWQAWMDAHDRARLPALPAKEPDAAIGKNCFTI